MIAGLPAGSPVSARGPTVPNQLLTKKLLWRGYKKTSKGRPRGEKGEQDYSAEIFPLDQVWSPWCFLHFPILHRKPLFPCVLVIIHPWYHHWVRLGRSSCWRLEAGTNPGGSFAWSLLKVFRWYLSDICTLFAFIYKETRLCSRIIFLYAYEILVLNSSESGYLKIFYN